MKQRQSLDEIFGVQPTQRQSLDEIFGQGQPQPPAQAPVDTRPTSEMTMEEKVRRLQQSPEGKLGKGITKGLKDVVMGTMQTGADIFGAEDKFRELLAESQQRSQRKHKAQVGDSKAAKVGEFVGEAAPYVAALPAGAASLLGRMGYGLLGGAIAGGTAPKEEALTRKEALKERAGEAAIGGTIGAVIPGAVGVAPVLKKGIEKTVVKLTKINPQAAKDFLSEGVQKSLAALSDRPSIQLVDRWLSKFPGGAGVMQKNTNNVLDDIEGIINKGTPRAVTPQQAGEAIKAGAEKYTERFQNVATKLYGRLDKYLPAESKVNVENITKTLADEIKNIPPQLSERLAKNEGIKILQDISDDALDGSIAYKDLRRYRTILGQKLSKPHLLAGEDEAVLSKAYGAMTEDMKLAATNKGPKALQAFNKANDFYRRGADNIKRNLDRVISKDAPEQVYQAALSGTKLGGTKINSIMKSLSREERSIVRESVIKNLGKARAGGQDATGDVFSPRTFMTEWNKISPEAKAALFDKQTRGSLDKLARINQRITQLDRFSNPSGTSQQLSTGALLATAFYDPATAAGALIGANTSARLMSNQKFLNWLANASTKAKTPQSVAAHIKGLSKIAEDNPSISGDIAKYLGVIGAVTTRDE